MFLFDLPAIYGVLDLFGVLPDLSPSDNTDRMYFDADKETVEALRPENMPLDDSSLRRIYRPDVTRFKSRSRLCL